MKPTISRTKIIATMGPASSPKETLRKMFEAGLDVCRLNFFAWKTRRAFKNN